jgi:hypothetical protein
MNLWLLTYQLTVNHKLCEIAKQAAHFHILGLEGGGFICYLALAIHVLSFFLGGGGTATQRGSWPPHF